MTIRSRKQFSNNNTYSQLEHRHLLSADLAIEPLGSAAEPAFEWAEIQWQGESVLARNDQWIIWQENEQGIQAAGQNTLRVGAETTLTSFSASAAADAATEQKLQVTHELASGLFLLSGNDSFSYEEVAESVAAWVPNAIVEPDFKITTTAIPDDTEFGQLWGLNNTGQSGGTVDADIDAVEAWEVTTGSSDVVVGVIDTGIDYNHPDLVDNIWTNPGEIAGDGIDNDGNGYIDDIHGWDFANNDNDPFDDDGHGTHVAGTIGAVGNNSLGVVGVSQDVSLVALKFLGPDGGSTTGAIQAIEYANSLKDSGTNLVMTNNSWGGGGFSTSLQNAIQNALDRDILFVAAAGNDGTSAAAYPASYDLDNIISVAATDRNDQLASFSNYNSTRVDLAAPGVDILSTTPNNNYSTFDGTSMASPHVAGALALLAANEPNLTALELKAKLLDRVDVLPQLTGDVLTGGRLNVYSLLDQISAVNFTAETFVTPGVVGIDIVDETGFDLGATVTIVSSSGDSETLTIPATTALEFSTAINSVAGVANANDGILQVASGDTLTVTYFDADYEGGVTRSDSAVIFVDDHGNDSASATAVDVPFTVSGNIEVSNDLDWFRFNATAGLEYDFQVALGSLTSSVLSLYDTDGSSLLESINSSSSSITWIAPSDGTYFVSVGHLSNNSGTYDLSATSVIPESTIDFDAAAFVAPGTVGLQLTDPTGFAAGATVMIETSSGDVETIAITATGSMDFSASISSVEGAANANDGILQISSGDTLTATYIDADDGFGGTFTATDTATIVTDDHGNDAATATTIGEVPFDVAGEIEIDGDRDWFRFDVIGGLEYEFGTTLGTLFRSSLALYDTDGTTLLDSDAFGGDGLSSLIEWRAPESGSYYLEVQGYADSYAGTYQLTSRGPDTGIAFTEEIFSAPGPISVEVVDPTGFTAGATVSIAASSGDTETVTISATGELISTVSINSVQGAANANDGILQVTSGDTITATYVDPDDGSGGTITVTDSVSVIGDDHGGDAANATIIDGLFSVAGEIELEGDQDWFGFDAIAGFDYAFETTLDSLSYNILTLYDTDGLTSLDSDSFGGADGSLIEWQAPLSGRYYLSVQGYFESFLGTYQITGMSDDVSNISFNAETYNVPSTIVVDVGDLNGFAAGATLTIESSSGDSETVTISPAGSTSFSTSIESVVGTANSDDGILQVASGDTLTASYADTGLGVIDTAFIFVDDHGNEATNATAVGSPFDVSGDLERSGDEDWFRFDAVAGLQYEFETTLSGLSDSTLTLYGTNGTTQLSYNDDGGAGLASRITWQAPESGSYYLAVRAYNNNKEGGYQLTGSAASSVVVDVIASSTGFLTDFIDSIDGAGVGAGNGMGYSLVGNHQLQSIPWLSVDTIYVQFSDDVSASIAAGDILLTGTHGGVYDMQMITYHTESNTAEFRINDGMDIDSLVISIMDGAIGNANGGLLDGEWAGGQADPSGDGNVGGQFDFFFNVLPGDEDGSGQVNSTDAFAVFASNTDATSETNHRRDIDGSGQINSTDAFAAFAYNTSGLPGSPIAPVSPATAFPATKISLVDNDDFFAKQLSTLKVEDSQVSHADGDSPTTSASVSLEIATQPSALPSIFSASDFGTVESSEGNLTTTTRQEIVLREEAVQSLGLTLQAFETPDRNDTDSEKEKQTALFKHRFSANTDLLDSVIGTLSGEKVPFSTLEI